MEILQHAFCVCPAGKKKKIPMLWIGYTYDVFAPIVIGDGQVLPDLVKNGQPFNSIKKAIG